MLSTGGLEIEAASAKIAPVLQLAIGFRIAKLTIRHAS